MTPEYTNSEPRFLERGVTSNGNYATARAAYDHAWQRYQRLEASSDVSAANLVVVLHHVEKLGEELERKALHQTLDTFSRWTGEARRRQSYGWAIQAAIALGNTQMAVHIYYDAARYGRLTLPMSQTLIRYIVQGGNAEAGGQVLTALKDSAGQVDNKVFDLLKTLDPDVVLSGAEKLGISAIEASTKTSIEVASLREFAVKALLRVLTIKGIRSESHNRYNPVFSALRKLVSIATEHFIPCFQLFMSMKLIEFEKLAMRCYDAVRRVPKINIPKDFLEDALKRMLITHDENYIMMLWDDLIRKYGLATPELCHLMMREMSFQGNSKTFYQILDRYREVYGNPTDPRVYQQLLNMHSRRLEISEVVSKFNSLQTDYGFLPTIDCWNSVIAAHARVSDHKGALNWYGMMAQNKVWPDANTISTLTSMYASGGDVAAIEGLIKECRQRRLKLSTSMIDSLVMANIKNHDIKKAEKIVRDALKLDLVGSRTHMWNYLLNAVALQCDLSKLHYLHRCMAEADIPSDAITYGALMQGFCVQGLPQSAEKILHQVMPSRQLRVTAFHYAVLMGGFLNTKEFHRVFKTYQAMVNNKIKPNFSTQTILLKAAALKDEAEYKDRGLTDEPVNFKLAQELLSQTLEVINTSSVALPGPVKGVGAQGLDEAFPSNYFEYLIHMNAQKGNNQEVLDLFDQYIETTKRLRPGKDIELPLKMITALMISHRKLDNHDEVERYWYLAVEKAQAASHRTGAALSEPGWVLPAQRLLLHLPLLHYMKSLLFTGRVDDIKNVLDDMSYAGYDVSNKCWNLYVQALCKAGQAREAFSVAESELMDNWKGWRYSGSGRGNDFRDEKSLPQHLRRDVRLPDFRTFIHLDSAYADVQSRFALSGAKNVALQTLREVAPRALQATIEMPNVGNWARRKYLGQIEGLPPTEREELRTNYYRDNQVRVRRPQTVHSKGEIRSAFSLPVKGRIARPVPPEEDFRSKTKRISERATKGGRVHSGKGKPLHDRRFGPKKIPDNHPHARGNKTPFGTNALRSTTATRRTDARPPVNAQRRGKVTRSGQPGSGGTEERAPGNGRPPSESSLPRWWQDK
ncbi:hypothetical protein MMC19_002521 [Ptychographa xylographoides]|nr:hypothetical protein [Ptychographa xylographoides]